MKIYDMIIVGGGPGGYTAALYAARAGLSVLVLERLSAGGQMALTDQVDNYPGFPEGIDGYTLGMKMQEGAERFGAQTEYAEVYALHLEDAVKRVETSEGDFFARTLVLATGAGPRKLGAANEDALLGRGVHYCAACDGMFYRGKTVAVVGGGNSAVAEALHLSRIAKEVILIHRRDTLRATKIYHESLKKAKNVRFLWNSQVTELLHGEKLTGLLVKNTLTGEEEQIACDGAFVSIGRKPATELAAGKLHLDDGGYVVADESTRTSVPGVYAVGDLRTKPLRQIITAASDGATAVHFAQKYLTENVDN